MSDPCPNCTDVELRQIPYAQVRDEYKAGETPPPVVCFECPSCGFRSYRKPQ